MTRHSHIPRITQIDSKSLDDEVFLILKTTFASAFQFRGQSILVKLQPEFETALKLFLYHFTIGKNSQSVGQQLLQIKYNENSNNQKLKCFILFIILSSWLKQRFFFITSYIGKENLKSKVIKIFEALENIYQTADLLNLMYFLVKGKYPTLLERLLALNVIPVDENKVRSISYAYFTRELLWNGFADLLSTTLPLIPAKKFHNILIQFLPGHFSSDSSTKDGTSEMCSTDKTEMICSICNEFPVLPQRFGCKHVTCYYCIHSTIQVTPFKCPNCGVKVDNPSEIIRL